ncbi:lipocalin family protein [Thiohalocapsa marina]|uniref:Outer membrane lipoprotein Blc n=1 Tax=Thiohalocapsa marina TaxID=424902 RepID=A0A5M8FKA2_9GAMM|nr:lipocalin family protein [Thiohalocapsa marina]KAA6185117.1 lipocalin family protein [Thiohalocapsa marina]
MLALTAVAVALLLSACASEESPMDTVPHVDLERFMGDWYVVAVIPTFLEKDAYNPLESYALNPDGTIATRFTFNKGSLDGPRKVYHPTGFVRDTQTNALWGMQFIWPFKGDFRIIYLDEGYQLTVIGRAKRDYVWVMARDPAFSDADFERMKAFVASVGYDASQLQRPQHSPR